MNKREAKDWLLEHPDYIKILENLVQFELENPGNNDYMSDEYDCCWDHTEVGENASRLYQLESNGFLKRVMDTNSVTGYSIKDRETVAEVLDEVSQMQNEEGRVVMHTFPEEENELDGVFDKVVGYNDVKWLLKRAMTTQEITNVLLLGPTGSAKTVFLMCIDELEESKFISGKPTSGPGVLDVMFEETPKYMLIDEMDDMDGEVQQVLSQYTETGIVDETKVGKSRKLKTNTKTFGSANYEDQIIQQIQDRFLDLHFDPYTKEEYVEVCQHVLPEEEGSTEEEAKAIAEGVWDIENEGDVRKAIQVARLSRGDPDEVMKVLSKYSGTQLLKK